MHTWIRRAPALALLAAALVSSGPASAFPNPWHVGDIEVATRLDDETECSTDGVGDVVPDKASTDPAGREPVDLDLLVLLDGVSKKEAQAIVTSAQQSYDPLNVTLKATYKRFTVKSDGTAADGQPTRAARSLLDEIAAAYGSPPEGIDVVHLLTSKDLLDDENPNRDGTDATGGEAACVGGIRLDGQQFSVSEARFRFAAENDPADDFHAIAFAHEIGHLLGAHHHYGNCAEGRVVNPAGQGSCTVMFPLAALNSARFGTLESRVIAGYAESYAAATD